MICCLSLCMQKPGKCLTDPLLAISEVPAGIAFETCTDARIRQQFLRHLRAGFYAGKARIFCIFLFISN